MFTFRRNIETRKRKDLTVHYIKTY